MICLHYPSNKHSFSVRFTFNCDVLIILPRSHAPLASRPPLVFSSKSQGGRPPPGYASYYSAEQCSTLQCSAVQNSTVKVTVKYSAVQCSKVQYSLQNSMLKYSMVKYSSVNVHFTTLMYSVQ